MEDTDDLHVCLKCHDQIVGLENYIQHRKSTCPGKPREDETVDRATGVPEQTSIAQVSPDATKKKGTTNEESESNNKVAEESCSSPTSQGRTDRPLVSQPNGEVHQQKRKRGRPQKIPQPSTVDEETAGKSRRSSRPQRTKRTPFIADEVQVPKRCVEDESGDSDNGESSDEESLLSPTKSKRGRKPKRPLTEEEMVLLAECRVKNHYKCTPCLYVTTNLHVMLKHLNTIKHLECIGSGNPDAVVQCDACPMRFFSEKGLERHKQRHEQQCKCSKCDAVFQSRKELQTHHRTEHGTHRRQGEGGNVQTCEVCGKVLSRSYMKIHLRIHTGEKPFACDICPFKTNQHGDLKMHKKRHFGIKDHKCSLCDFVTVKASILKNHMKLHTKRERTEACPICPQMFYNKGLLKSHIRLRHEPSRIHPCTFPGCTYKFKFRMELITHMRRHTNEKPYLCTVCGYSGSTKQALTRHTRKHTGAKPFKCDHPGCNYMGRVSTHLTRHKRLHTGAKPYKCPYCSYRANTHENVRKHIRGTKKHAGFAVYVCKFCSDMKTDLYQELVDHMRQIHSDDYITFDQVSHQSGLLADKEEPPDQAKAQSEPYAEEMNEKQQVTAPMTTKLSQDLQQAAEDDQAALINVTTGDDDRGLEIVVPDEEAGEGREVRQDFGKEYILCRVIQDGSQHPQQEALPGDVDGSEAVAAAEDSGEMEEIQMVTVEEGAASEAIEMILRQAVSSGSSGSQDYIIL